MLCKAKDVLGVRVTYTDDRLWHWSLAGTRYSWAAGERDLWVRPVGAPADRYLSGAMVSIVTAVAFTIGHACGYADGRLSVAPGVKDG